MNWIKRIYSVLLLLCVSIESFAQETTAAQQTDFMNSNGKIFVVLAVVVLIVLGLFAYLYALDRRITRLEKEEK